MREIVATYPRLEYLVKVSSYLGKIASDAPPRKARLFLLEKVGADMELCDSLTKLGYSILEAIGAAKKSDLLNLARGGAAAGLGFGAAASIPAVVAAKNMAGTAEDTAKNIGDYVTPAAAAVAALLAGKYMSGGGEDDEVQEKTSSLCAALGLHERLVQTAPGVKTAEDSEYISKVSEVSAAHIADLAADILL